MFESRTCLARFGTERGTFTFPTLARPTWLKPRPFPNDAGPYVQPNGSSRFAQPAFGRQWRLLPVAEAYRLGGLPSRQGSWHRMDMRRPPKREFSVVVHREEEGYYVASVPELRGCHTQARSLDRFMERIREAIERCLEVEGAPASDGEFIGVQRVAV